MEDDILPQQENRPLQAQQRAAPHRSPHRLRCQAETLRVVSARGGYQWDVIQVVIDGAPVAIWNHHCFKLETKILQVDGNLRFLKILADVSTASGSAANIGKHEEVEKWVGVHNINEVVISEQALESCRRNGVSDSHLAGHTVLVAPFGKLKEGLPMPRRSPPTEGKSDSPSKETDTVDVHGVIWVFFVGTADKQLKVRACLEYYRPDRSSDFVLEAKSADSDWRLGVRSHNFCIHMLPPQRLLRRPEVEDFTERCEPIR